MRLRAHTIVIFCAGALLAGTALLVPAAAHAETIVDATGARIEVSDTSRIVSIGGAITEILYALHLEDKIVAVDQTSFYPPAARKKPDVGYMRALSAEGVLGVNPALLLVQEGAGPKETMAVLAAAKVPMVIVPDRFTGEGVVEKVRLVAQAAGAPDRGACLAAAVEHDLAKLAQVRAKIERPLRVLFILSLQNGRPMVAGKNTAADGIISLAGAANAIQEYQGYKQLSDEAAVAANPDVILVMRRAGETLDAANVFAHPAFALTAAAKNGRFIAMDGLYLLGFGPRTASAARDLAHQLYPELDVTAAVPAVACP